MDFEPARAQVGVNVSLARKSDCGRHRHGAVRCDRRRLGHPRRATVAERRWAPTARELDRHRSGVAGARTGSWVARHAGARHVRRSARARWLCRMRRGERDVRTCRRRPLDQRASRTQHVDRGGSRHRPAFANPAVTIGRVFTDTFAGVGWSSAPLLVMAQPSGAMLAVALARFLYPDPAAADVIVPHDHADVP